MNTKNEQQTPDASAGVMAAPVGDLVADFMTRQVLAVRSDCSMSTAMDTVLVSGYGHLVVVDPDGALRAVLPAQIVATAMMTRLANPRETIAALVSGEPVRVSPDATVRSAASLMLSHSLDAVGVVDADGRLVGVLTWSDVGRLVAERGRT